MTRGATPYDRRGMPLVLPKGSIQNPSLRFWNERSGLYRGDDAVLGVTLKALKAFELTPDGASVHVQKLGAGHVTPLSLVRVNATTADDEETQTDYYETIAPIARAAVYRQSGTPTPRYGFKWYGFSAGLHATPAMTLSGDKDLTIGRDLIVTRNVIMSSGNMGLTPTAHNTGLYLGADALTPSVRMGNNDVEADSTNRLEIGLNVGAATLGGSAGDSVLRTVGASAGRLLLAPNDVVRLTLATDGVATFGGPSAVVSPATGPASFGTAPLAANQNSTLSLTSNANAQVSWLTHQGGSTAHGLGTAIGDLSLYTNATGGALRLGTRNAIRLYLEAVGNMHYYIPPGGGGFTVHKSTDSTPVWYVNDLGMSPNSVGEPQIKDESITAAKMVPGTLAYVPLAGNALMTGLLHISMTSPADPVSGYLSMPLILSANGNTPPGITFRRSGVSLGVLYEQGGQPYWSAAQMWTDGNVAAVDITGKLGYTPINPTGGTMTGNLTLGDSASLAGGGGIYLDRSGASAHGIQVITRHTSAFPLILQNQAGGYGFGLRNQDGSNWTLLISEGGATFGVQTIAPTFYATGAGGISPIVTGTTNLCPNLNAQYLNGKSDAYLVPVGMRAYFPSSTLPAGWVRDTNANGRVIAGSGASFSSVTFGEASHHGSNNWTPASGLGADAGSLKTVAASTSAWGGGQAGATAGGLNLDPLNHTHGIPVLSMSGSPGLTGTGTVWVPPTYALVMAYKQ